MQTLRRGIEEAAEDPGEVGDVVCFMEPSPAGLVDHGRKRAVVGAHHRQSGGHRFQCIETFWFAEMCRNAKEVGGAEEVELAFPLGRSDILKMFGQAGEEDLFCLVREVGSGCLREPTSRS